MRRLFFLSTLAIVLISFCTGCKHEVKPQFEALQEIDTTNMRKCLLDCIEQYISQHKKDSAFIIFSTQLYRESGEYLDFNYDECYAIVVGYNDSFDCGEFTIPHRYKEYPSRYFKIQDKYVFVLSPEDKFIDQKKLKKDYLSIVKTEMTPKDMKFLLVNNLKDNCRFIEDTYRGDSLEGRIIIKSTIRFTPPTIKE